MDPEEDIEIDVEYQALFNIYGLYQESRLFEEYLQAIQPAIMLADLVTYSSPVTTTQSAVVCHIEAAEEEEESKMLKTKMEKMTMENDSLHKLLTKRNNDLKVANDTINHL